MVELARHLGLSDDEVLAAIEADRSRRAVSLDAPAGEPGTVALSEFIPAPEPRHNLEDLILLPELIAGLPADERQAVLLYFFAGLRQQEIADRIGHSQMHVSRLLKRALATMRTSCSAAHLLHDLHFRRQWQQYGFGPWAAVDKDSGRWLGQIGLNELPRWPGPDKVEVGWDLHPSVWARGLATEGARAALAWGFEVVGLARIISTARADNAASRRVMAKCGSCTSATHVVPQLWLSREGAGS